MEKIYGGFPPVKKKKKIKSKKKIKKDKKKKARLVSSNVNKNTVSLKDIIKIKKKDDKDKNNLELEVIDEL